jgi:hypothetical protein
MQSRLEEEEQKTAQAAEYAGLRAENVQSQIEARNKAETYSRFEQGLLDDYTKRIASAQVAAGILFEAASLNEDSYTESMIDRFRRFGSRVADPDDPKLAIYEFMKNRLSANALASLKATFPGAISNAEREALDALQGASAETKEGRGMIFEATLGVMLDSIENSKKEIEKIKDRYYAGPSDVQTAEQMTLDGEVME